MSNDRALFQIQSLGGFLTASAVLSAAYIMATDYQRVALENQANAAIFQCQRDAAAELTGCVRHKIGIDDVVTNSDGITINPSGLSRFFVYGSDYQLHCKAQTADCVPN